ncbi:MAG TPA: Fe-S cluster assembly protein SufD [Thermoanaerobaculaceae bacterium]|nr:Fe-S cluster assembly protein SufD [Thermoanaerobaculaceae bacterium]HRS14685.1 Fe-S cluster assembly protein SufD [Thermoanaerobaculaceae bacterium]
MSAEPVFALDVPGLEKSLEAHEEPEALRAMRRQAREVLAGMALPDRARHLWRYTDPRLFVPALDAPGAAPADSPAGPAPEGPRSAAVVIADGAPHLLELGEGARRAGVVVADLQAAGVEGLLGSAVPASHGFVEALNAAAWRGGVLVRVPAGVSLEAPVLVRVIAGRAGSVSVPRVLVVAGEGSSFEVVESHVRGDGASTRVLSVTEVLVADGARVRYGLVQRWREGVVGHLTVRARLARGAAAQLSLASFGGAVVKADIGARLEGEGAEVETYGVAMGGNRQHLDHHTEHLHAAPHTRSNLDFKVALTQAARSAYTGMIRIAEGAGASEAYQENRNLLLSEHARAESIPELEILTDDVRCSHGATVAPLDPEQLFYLLSRGLPPGQAQRLIVYGFLDQTLQRLPETTRQRIEALVAERLHEEH